MSHAYANPYVVAAAAPSVRAEFIRRTYAHLALAILAFAGLEAFLLQTDWAVALAGKMMGNRMGWLLVLGAWMFVSWLAQSWAHSATSRGAQYAGLALFVAGEAILFLPLLLLASRLAPDGAIIKKAAAFTGVLFVALTAGAFLTRKDFSFLGGFLRIGGFVAMGGPDDP